MNQTDCPHRIAVAHAAWPALRRRLRRTLALAVILGLVQLSVRLRHEPARADGRGHPSEPRRLSVDGTLATDVADEGIAAKKNDDRVGADAPRRGRAVLPVGWRRTAHGWEHVSTWVQRNTQPLALRVHAQQLREPMWMQRTMAMVRTIPPGWFAVGQLLALGVILSCQPSRLRREPA